MITANLELPTGIGVGSTITAECWAPVIASGAVIGTRYDDEAGAIQNGINARRAYMARNPQSLAPTTITVERRLTMTIATDEAYRGAADFPVSRTTYEDIDDAQAHLDRIERYTSVGG